MDNEIINNKTVINIKVFKIKNNLKSVPSIENINRNKHNIENNTIIYYL